MQYNRGNENIQGQQNPGTYPGAEGNRVSTNMPDPHFDLISVLYHALEGAQVCAQYAEDANREGDKELAQFFIQAQQNQLSCAERAKQLLGRCVGQGALH